MKHEIIRQRLPSISKMNKKRINFQYARGSTLVTLLFFMVIAITVTTGAIAMLVTNSISGAKLQQGSIAYQIAESGIENAKLRLLRDQNYAGEALPVGGGTAVITVSSVGTNYTILSRGTVGNFVRQIQATASYANNLLTITSQTEIF